MPRRARSGAREAAPPGPTAFSTWRASLLPSTRMTVMSTCSGLTAGSTVGTTRPRSATTAGSRTARSLNCRSPAAPSTSATATAWYTLNFPSSPVCGVFFPVSSRTSGFTRSSTRSIRAGASPCSLRSWMAAGRLPRGTRHAGHGACRSGGGCELHERATADVGHASSRGSADRCGAAGEDQRPRGGAQPTAHLDANESRTNRSLARRVSASTPGP